MKKAQRGCFDWASYATITFISACSALFLRKRAELFHEYNGDIDTFLYQAWRLLGGHLNYLDHYDSKLPIVPYLYVPSFLTGSFGGHRVISDLCLLASGYITYELTSYISRHFLSASNRTASRGGLISATLYVFFGALLPDTAYSGHLFLFSSLFVQSGLLLIARGVRERRGGLIATGGSILGFAIQTRPNTLFCVAGLVVTFGATWTLYNRDSLKREEVYRSGRQVFLASLAGFLGFLLPFLPYAFNESHTRSAYALSYQLLSMWRRDVFGWDGVADFIASMRYLYTPRLFGATYILLLPIPALLASLIGIYKSRNRKALAVVLMSLLGYTSGGILSYFYSHVFPNYVFADLWVFCVLMGCSLATLSSGFHGQILIISRSCFILCGSLSLALLLQSFRISKQEDSRTYYIPDSLLTEIRDSSFSSPQNYSLYWRLKQHAPTFGAHTHWTEYANFKIKDKDFLKEHGLTTSPKETCNKYLDKGKEYLVLFDKDQFICPDLLKKNWTPQKQYDYRKDSPPTRLYKNKLFLED